MGRHARVPQHPATSTILAVESGSTQKLSSAPVGDTRTEGQYASPAQQGWHHVIGHIPLIRPRIPSTLVNTSVRYSPRRGDLPYSITLGNEVSYKLAGPLIGCSRDN